MVLNGLSRLINIDIMTQEQRICEAITDSINECNRCPDDSVQDIWNEILESWETGLRMDNNFRLEKQ